MQSSDLLDAAASQDWAKQDLDRIGDKLAAFGQDPMNAPHQVIALRDAVSRTVHRFSEVHGVQIL